MARADHTPGHLERVPDPVRRARLAGRRVVFFNVDGPAVERARGFRAIHIGEQPWWDPERWRTNRATWASLREQLRRVRAKGVRVELIAAGALAQRPGLQRAVAELIAQWLDLREMEPLGFVVDPRQPAPEEREVLALALRGEEMVGVLMGRPLEDGRWQIDHLLRLPRAPNGTCEALLDAAMSLAADRGIPEVTLGLAPLSGAIPIWLRPFRAARSPYNFHGLLAWKRRLRPDRWEPRYVLHEGTSLRCILDVLRAFAGESLLRFGLATVWRGPSALLRTLMAALLPWTVALAFGAPRTWFPSEAARWAWVVFNVLVLGGLWAWLRRAPARLGRALVVALVLDGIASGVEVLFFNFGRPEGRRGAELLGAGVAVAVPWFAAAFVRGHLRRVRPRPAIVCREGALES